MVPCGGHDPICPNLPRQKRMLRHETTHTPHDHHHVPVRTVLSRRINSATSRAAPASPPIVTQSPTPVAKPSPMMTILRKSFPRGRGGNRVKRPSRFKASHSMCVYNRTVTATHMNMFMSPIVAVSQLLHSAGGSRLQLQARMVGLHVSLELKRGVTHTGGHEYYD